MTPEDFPEFDAAFGDMMDVLSAGKHEPSARISGLWARVLAPYPLAAVLAGIEAHMRGSDTGRTLPIPADIIKQINATVANDGRLGADEAWATAVQAADEGATVVWTPEIAEAFGHVRHILAGRDAIGTRVAFREAYNRLVHAARCARRPVEWVAALGTDNARWQDGIREAVALGRLPMAALAELQALPPPGQPAGLLLAGPAGAGVTYDADGRRGPTAEDRERIARTLLMLAQPRESPADADRRRTAELKAAASDLANSHPVTKGVH